MDQPSHQSTIDAHAPKAISKETTCASRNVFSIFWQDIARQRNKECSCQLTVEFPASVENREGKISCFILITSEPSKPLLFCIEHLVDHLAYFLGGTHGCRKWIEQDSLIDFFFIMSQSSVDRSLVDHDVRRAQRRADRRQFDTTLGMDTVGIRKNRNFDAAIRRHVRDEPTLDVHYVAVEAERLV